jgi:hypothetical protein
MLSYEDAEDAVVSVLEFLLLGKKQYKLKLLSGEDTLINLPCLGLFSPVVLKGKGLKVEGTKTGDLYVSSFFMSTKGFAEAKELAKKIILMILFLLVMMNPQLIFLFFLIKPLLT